MVGVNKIKEKRGKARVENKLAAYGALCYYLWRPLCSPNELDDLHTSHGEAVTCQ